jgi:hypothetical protein
MNTFQRYFQQFTKFEQKVLAWKPDYVVPVAKKGCKLLKVSNQQLTKINPNLIRYRTYFQINNENLNGKKIAVLDDATQFTSSLKEYRNYFERQGANVRTFSFVGHENLYYGKAWKYDEKAEIEIFLPDPVYQEYILQQSYFLLEKGNHFDLDHLIFESALPQKQFHDFLKRLRLKGILLFLEDYFPSSDTIRFSLNDPRFFDYVPFLTDKSISMGNIRKIKFVYKKSEEKLFFSPLIFPVWDYKTIKEIGELFTNIPFELPIKLPINYNYKKKGNLLRIYYNIQLIFMSSLTKAFIQQFPNILNDLLIVKRDDLDATFGVEETNNIIFSTKKFIFDSKVISFNKNIENKPKPSARNTQNFKNFGQVINYLKKGYKNLCRSRKTNVGVHYYLLYSTLFNSYTDKVSLSENLDYYCDFGVIVPETINKNGKIQRACRTGEPNSEYNWLRTQLLIPLVIEIFRKEQSWKESSTPPMILIKLLSNLIYDYPSQQNHELHCLIGEPYTFGTMVKAYHHHRARSKPTIYLSEKISPYYRWDQKKNRFCTIKLPEVLEKILHLFDERQEIPYTEIVTYIKLLSEIYTLFKRVDILNMLSICREQNYFYSHVLYNIRTWFEEFANYIEEPDTLKSINKIHKCGTQCNSAHEKISLAQEIDPTMKKIEEYFEGNFDFVKAMQKLKKNYFKFKPEFKLFLNQLNEIIILQIVVTNICLFVHKHDKKYKDILDKFKFQSVLSLNMPSVSTDLDELSNENSIFIEFLNKAYNRISLLIDSLPSEEEPLLTTILKHNDHERARNIATIYVYNENLDRISILYIDFTGLRNIPEPKEYIIGEFYSLVEKYTSNRSGQKLSGGKGGDDAFSFAFKDINPAIQCVKDIRREFERNIFLAPQGDVKFGIGFTILPVHSKESETIRCWGLAKDCCEFKSPTFTNRRHLLISQLTVDNIKKAGYSFLSDNFIILNEEKLKDGTQIYYLKEFD